ncbi:MAG: OmpW family outer membrane protein [Pseudomonadota bacterium]
MNICTKARLASVSILLIGSAGGALAQDASDGFYLKLLGGASFLSDADLSGAALGKVGFDTGFLAGGAVGYSLSGSGLRGELEYAYRTGDADGKLGITGDLASTSFALNAFYDFSPIGTARITPYVGAGLAYVTEIDFDVVTGPIGEYSKSGIFGYQLMVGADVPIAERWSLNGELRYFDAGSQSLRSPTSAILRTDYATLDLVFGATFRF